MCLALCPLLSLSIDRFTTYDFKKMHRRSYYPQNQLASQMTTSTGCVSSRPETPSLTEREYAELGHPSVNIRGLSLDSDDRLETRGVVRGLTDEHGSNYVTAAIPMATMDKDRV